MRTLLVPTSSTSSSQSAAASSCGVAEELRRAIFTGRYGPGDRLPTEQAICQTYGVSRIAAREGLRILQGEALIQRRRGSGSYVLPQATRRIALFNAGYSRSIEPVRHEMSRQVTQWRWIEAEAWIAERLSLKPGQSVLWARRLDLWNSNPVAEDELWIEGSRASHLTREDLEQLEFVERWEKVQGIEVSHVRQTIEAVAATAELARGLEIRRRTPLLKETAEPFVDRAQVPSAIFVTHYRSDAYCLETTVIHRRSTEATQQKR